MKHVALGMSGLALILVIVAIATRPAPVVVTEPTCKAPEVVDLPIDPVAPTDPKPQPMITPTGPPKIEGVKARAAVKSLGVDVQLDVALAQAGPLTKQESVIAKATCLIDGEWFTGTGYMRLSKVPGGTSVVHQTIAIGSQHAFAKPPEQCQLGFEYTSYASKPMQRESLGRMCWDGTTVSDKPCAMKPNTAVSVSALRVESARSSLTVSLDAQLQRPLDDWSIEVAADCTLPDGTKQRANSRVYARDVHANRPFTGRTHLFTGKQQMVDVPAKCTVAVEVADRSSLVREPVSAWCWRDGSVASGACA